MNDLVIHYNHQLGYGTYSNVYRAQKGKDVMALKHMFIRFVGPDEDAEAMLRAFLREATVLRLFSSPNIVKMHDTLCLQGKENGTASLGLSLELMDGTVRALIKNGNKVSESIAVSVIHQLLHALHVLHAANVAHRDIKLDNMLLDRMGRVCLSDFGMARYMKTPFQDGRSMTSYVVSRFYRAWELLTRAGPFTTAIDMWSVGCVFAELLLGQPLWSGDSTLQQCAFILKLLGVPPQHILQRCPYPAITSYVAKHQGKLVNGLRDYFPQLSIDGLYFLHRCFDYDPETRITVTEALALPLFRDRERARVDPSSPPVDVELVEKSFEFDLHEYSTMDLWAEAQRLCFGSKDGPASMECEERMSDHDSDEKKHDE